MNGATYYYRYRRETPQEQARLRVVYALTGTAFFLPLQLAIMELFFILAVIAAVYYYKKYGGFRRPTQPLQVPAACFAGAALLSLIGSEHSAFGLAFYCFTILQYIILYWLIQSFIGSKNERLRLLIAVVAAATVVGIYGMIQFFFLLTPASAQWVDKAAFPLLYQRMYATLYNPNLLAQFLLMTLSVSVFLAGSRRRPAYRRVLYGVSLLLAVCTVLTYSRGAWLALAALTVYLGAVRDKRWWLLLLVVPGVLTVYHGGLTYRLLSVFTTHSQDTSVIMRWSMWKSALQMTAAHPALGIGWGEFKFVYPHYNWLIRHAGMTIYHAHNMFLNILAETGMGGIFFFLWFFWGHLYYAGGQGTVRSWQSETYIPELMGSVILVTFVTGCSDFDLFSTQISMVFWLICGIFASCYEEKMRKKFAK